MDRELFREVVLECQGNQVLIAAYFRISTRMVRKYLRSFGLYPEYYRVKKSSRGTPIVGRACVDVSVMMSWNRYDEVREVCRLAIMAGGGSMLGASKILGIDEATVRKYVARLGLRPELDVERRKAMARRKVVDDVEREHRTTCWMSPLMRGTDSQRRKLVGRIKSAFKETNGNVHRAAEKLGINISTLRRYVERLELQEFVDECRGDGGVARAAGVAHGTRGGRPRPNPG